MSRALPVGPEVVVANPAFSVLATLGLEDSVVQMGLADMPVATDLLDPIPDAVLPAASAADVASTDAVTLVSVGPAQAPLTVETLEGAGDVAALLPADPHAEEVDASATESSSAPLLVIVPFEFSAEANAVAIPIQVQQDLSFLDRKIVVDFRSENLDLSAAFAADSTAIDVSDAARPGGGGGSGGGGGGGGGIVTQYHSGSAEEAGYDIVIQFKGTGWTGPLQDAFTKAADYFTTVITDDIGGGGRIGQVVVDDLYVTAEVKTIDGVGGILGQAGPSHVWTNGQLTADGQMQFDVADATTYLNKGLWDDIVTHEMMHVLGFGSLWNYGDHAGLVSGGQYTGAAAVAAYDAAIPVTTELYIPVETDGGSGTAGSHWDEQALINELMTGYINDDHNATTVNDNYLSKFSVMSLADLGYVVKYSDYTYDGTPTT